MQLKICSCKGCGNTRPIVNVKYGLCNQCNRVRLGSTKVSYELKRTVLKPKKGAKRINPLSDRKIQIRKELKIVKEAVEERDERRCQGCRVGQTCDKSHILSVGQREDLELEIDNIQLLCRSCHMKWESWDVEKMLDLNCFESNMRYIEANDEGTFWKLVYKLKEYLSSQRTSLSVVSKIQSLYFYTLIKN